MRQLFYPLSFFLVGLMAIAISCSKPEPEAPMEKSPEGTAEPDSDAPYSEDELFDMQGSDPEALLEEWAKLGEDERYLKASMSADEEGLLLEIYLWRVSEAQKGVIEPFKIALPAGKYSIQGFGGVGFKQVNMSVSTRTPDMEVNYLDSSEIEGASPLVSFELLKPELVLLELIPQELNAGYDHAYYCWLIYQD